jgi:putative heme iron utilization protein
MSSDAPGAPLLLLSDLARHSAHVAGDARVSLLLDGTHDASERLTGSRLTLTGSLEVCEGSDDLQRRYLAQHPQAGLLLSMADFRFYRMNIEAGHLVAGFGRIDTVAAEDLLVVPALVEDLSGMEQSAIDHMTDDHGDAIALLAGFDEPCRLVAIDADGLSLLAGEQPVRVMFSDRLETASQLRTAIAKVVRQIRRKLE